MLEQARGQKADEGPNGQGKEVRRLKTARQQETISSLTDKKRSIDCENFLTNGRLS